MSKINSRNKGRRGEYEVRDLFRQYGYDAERGGAMHTKGSESPDVYGVPDLQIEVKRRERIDYYAGLEQAARDARERNKGELPVLVSRKNDSRWIVTMYFEDWIELYREWEAGNWLMDHSETTK